MAFILPRIDNPTDDDLYHLSLQLAFTNHAIKRYRERLDPQLKLGQAKKELKMRILQTGTLQESAPPWLSTLASENSDRLYIILDERIALPLRYHDTRGQGRPTVLTVLIKGYQLPSTISASARERHLKRCQAQELGKSIIISSRCLRNYSKGCGGSYSDLVAQALHGRITSQAPAYSHLPKQDKTAAYLDCGSFILSLIVCEDRFKAVGCLWPEHV